MLTYFTKLTYIGFLSYFDTWPSRLTYVGVNLLWPLTIRWFFKLTLRYAIRVNLLYECYDTKMLQYVWRTWDSNPRPAKCTLLSRKSWTTTPECHVRNILIAGSPKELVGHFGTTKKFGAFGWDKKIPKFFFFFDIFLCSQIDIFTPKFEIDFLGGGPGGWLKWIVWTCPGEERGRWWLQWSTSSTRRSSAAALPKTPCARLRRHDTGGTFPWQAQPKLVDSESKRL